MRSKPKCKHSTKKSRSHFAISKFLNEIKNRMIETANPEKIILFGSWAKGKATMNSDIDLMVIEKKTFNKKHSRRRQLTKFWLELADIPLPKDIVLYSEEEVELWKDSKNHLIARALKEGRVLYERS